MPLPISAAFMPVIIRVLGWAILLLSLAGGAGWLYHKYQIGSLKYDLRSVEADRDYWEAAATERKALLESERAERIAIMKAIRSVQLEIAGVEQRYQALQHKIRDSPPADDGPVAPVLRQALEDLP